MNYIAYTAFYTKTLLICVYYTKTSGPKKLGTVPKIAPQSPLNIRYDKSKNTINVLNCSKKSHAIQGNSVIHISPKHNKKFKNFVLKLLCVDKTLFGM